MDKFKFTPTHLRDKPSEIESLYILYLIKQSYSGFSTVRYPYDSYSLHEDYQAPFFIIPAL